MCLARLHSVQALGIHHSFSMCSQQRCRVIALAIALVAFSECYRRMKKPDRTPCLPPAKRTRFEKTVPVGIGHCPFCFSFTTRESKADVQNGSESCMLCKRPLIFYFREHVQHSVVLERDQSQYQVQTVIDPVFPVASSLRLSSARFNHQPNQ